MKRALSILIALAMVLSLGMACAQAQVTWHDSAYPTYTELVTIGYFTKEGRVIESETVSLFEDDGFGNAYGSLIYCDRDESSIEYRLGRAYASLDTTFYVPTHALQNGWDHRWDSAEIRIFGDGELLCTVSGFTAYSEPLPVSIDVSNVNFLKIEFNNTIYFYSGMTYPLVALGNPVLVNK